MSQSLEDAKLITLARSSRARIDAREGAAVRDLDGRTYTAASISLRSLTLDALPLAVAMAASSGARGLEAAAVVTEEPNDSIIDLAAVRDLAGAGIPVLVAGPSGAVSMVKES
jgi:hypothetical protein